MLSHKFLPTPALREYVKCYRFRHFVFSGAANLSFKPYAPRPEQTLTFYPRDPEVVEYVSNNTMIQRPRSMLMGQYVERTNRHLGGADFIIFLVDFHPGVLYRITGIPFDEFTNTFADAEAIFSKEIRRVNERLNSAESDEEMVEIVESFLLGLVQSITRDTHPIDKVTNLIIHHPENTSLDELSDASCLCPRQFERKFRERMGISPKLFARIARVNKAYRIKYNHPAEDWLSIALACGYHDYQHLVKDFKDFAGEVPTSYLLQDTQAPERVFRNRNFSSD